MHTGTHTYMENVSKNKQHQKTTATTKRESPTWQAELKISFFFKKKELSTLDVVVHIFDPNPWESEIGGSLGVPASLIHIGLCNEILGGGERRGVERSSFLGCYTLSVSQMTPGS